MARLSTIAALAMTLAACAPTLQRGETVIPHPAAADSLGSAAVKFELYKFFSLTVLTDRTVCVEFIDQSSPLFEDELQDELKEATVHISVDGAPPKTAELTQAAPRQGGQFCVNNDFVGPDSKRLEATIEIGRDLLVATWNLEGGRPRDGAWGARGRTRFPNAKESHELAKAMEAERDQGGKRMAKVIAALEAKGIRCGAPPAAGMLKVECDVGAQGPVELWSTGDAGAAFQFISVWYRKSNVACETLKARLDRVKREQRVKGELVCHLKNIKLKNTYPYGDDVDWASLLRRHVEDGDRASAELTRYPILVTGR